jgi:microcystin-dependent protein
MLNGLVTEITIPCTYVTEVDGVETELPILLTTEGYGDPEVAFGDDAPAGLTAWAEIDAEDESIINLVISAQCPSAVDEDQTTDLSVLISRGDGLTLRTDVVMHGELTIQHGPLPSTPPPPLPSAGAESRALYAGMLGYGVMKDFDGSITGDVLTITEGSAIVEGAFFDVLGIDRDVALVAATSRILLRWTLDTLAFTLVSVPTSQAIVRTTAVWELPLGVATIGGSMAWDYEMAGTLADPVGSFRSFGVYEADIPKSHVVCDGRAISRTLYPRLFAKIGTFYGGGDLTTTFNVPDKRARTPICLDVRDSDIDSLAKTGGAKTVALAEANMPAHLHTVVAHNHSIDHDHASTTSSSNGAHTHEVPHGGDSRDYAGGNDASFWFTSSSSHTDTTSEGAHTHTTDIAALTGNSGNAAPNTDSKGSGTAHSNVQPFHVELVCIRA